MLSLNLRRLWAGKRPLSENAALLSLAVAVGLVTGVGVWLFKLGIEFFTRYYQESLAGLFGGLFGAWAIVPVLALAGLIVGALLERFIGEERHHGVAGIMEAVALAGGRLRFRRMPMKAALAAFSIGAGASVGPEDPSVQIGANLGSMFGQWLGLSDERVRLLVAAGVASGIASAFRAPIAGVFFALEVILGDLSTGSFGVVVLAAVIASVFTQAVDGGGHELGIRAYSLGGVEELPLYILLGLLMAPISAACIWLLYRQHDLWHGIHLPRPLKTALAGALVGVIAVFLPQIMGTGRDTLQELLNAGGIDFTIPMLLALAFGKIIATTISLGGGFVGGMFAPSLFVGAAIGSAFGHLANQIFPQTLSANPAAYAMAGMAAAMTGVIRAPITAVLLLFELTGDYNLILPIMLVSVVCLLLVERLAPDGIYHHGLARKGIRLSYGRDTDLMQTITVRDAMTPVGGTLVPASLPARDLEATFSRTDTHGMIVMHDDGLLYGVVTLQDLAKARQRDDFDALTVGDICTREVLTVTQDDLLSEALHRMGPRDLGRLPVVDSADPRRMVGVLRRRDIVRAYDIALQRKLEQLRRGQQVRLATFAENEVIELRIAPGAAADGKLIRDVIWPSGALIASIRRDGHTLVPHGDTALHTGDVLTIVTTPEHEGALARLVEIAAS